MTANRSIGSYFENDVQPSSPWCRPLITFSRNKSYLGGFFCWL